MKNILCSLFFLLFISINSNAQNLSAYINIRNEFYFFEDSITRQIDYLPPENYKIGGNAIAYNDKQSTFKIYQYGNTYSPIRGSVLQYEMTNELVLVRTAGSLYAFEDGNLNLLTHFPGAFAICDSMIGFVDYASRNFLVYHNGNISTVKEGTTDVAVNFVAYGSNVIAVKTFDNTFGIYYHDSLYEQETEYPETVLAGANIVAYIDQYDPGFRIFYKGVTKKIEEFNPQIYVVGDDCMAYISADNIFKIFWNGNLYTIGNYTPVYFKAKDNVLIYADRTGYLYTFWQGKSVRLENFIPDKITIGRNTFFYFDQSNHLKIFQNGKLTEMPFDTYLSVVLDYDVVKMKMSQSQFRFFSNGNTFP
ncbi:MAG: hypothetical protein LH473_10740 [Chitinophagales bacterium]|nr:hypothetical protein [Chitinophagales bacterium]